jgi:hypothetical protein
MTKKIRRENDEGKERKVEKMRLKRERRSEE